MSSTTRCHQHRGFSLAGLSVVIVVLAVLAAILLPALAAGQKKSSKIGCVNNLKQCELAFRVWEGDNGDKYPMDVSMTNGGTMEFITGADTFRHFQVMSNELDTPKILICPQDTRTAADNFDHLKNRNVSYFVGLDAKDEFPQRFLDGDRNITGESALKNGILKLVPGQRASWTESIHVKQGNLGLVDGSVQ